MYTSNSLVIDGGDTARRLTILDTDGSGHQVQIRGDHDQDWVISGTPEAVIDFLHDALLRLEDLRARTRWITEPIPAGRFVSERGDIEGRLLAQPAVLALRHAASALRYLATFDVKAKGIAAEVMDRNTWQADPEHFAEQLEGMATAIEEEEAEAVSAGV